MSRELQFDEVLEYLRDTVFDDETAREIIKIMKEGTFFRNMEERIEDLEELTAKMDKCIESELYTNYKGKF